MGGTVLDVAPPTPALTPCDDRPCGRRTDAADVVGRWAARARDLAQAPGAPRELRDALARERVRARLGALGVAWPAPTPEDAERARDLALEVSARSAARVLLDAGPLRGRRPGVIAHTWSLEGDGDAGDVETPSDAGAPRRRPPLSVGVLAYPTWGGTGAGTHAELRAETHGATLTLAMDPPGRAWRASVRIPLAHAADLMAQARSDAVRVEVRTRLRAGVWLRGAVAADIDSDAGWSGSLRIEVR